MLKDKTRLTYEIIENDIHWFCILESNRQTVEDVFDKLTEIRQSGLYDDRPNKYLFNSEGVDELPIRYLIQRAEKWQKEQSFIPPTKTALLYKLNGLMLFAVNTLIKTFNKHDSDTRIFPPHLRNEAIAWLQAED